MHPAMGWTTDTSTPVGHHTVGSISLSPEGGQPVAQDTADRSRRCLTQTQAALAGWRLTQAQGALAGRRLAQADSTLAGWRRASAAQLSGRRLVVASGIHFGTRD